MADDPRDAPPTGTLWLNIGLVAGALLVTGGVQPAWLPAGVFAFAVVMYIRARTRSRDAAPVDDEGVGGPPC